MKLLIKVVLLLMVIALMTRQDVAADDKAKNSEKPTVDMLQGLWEGSWENSGANNGGPATLNIEGVRADIMQESKRGYRDVYVGKAVGRRPRRLAR